MKKEVILGILTFCGAIIAAVITTYGGSSKDGAIEVHGDCSSIIIGNNNEADNECNQ